MAKRLGPRVLAVKHEWPTYFGMWAETPHLQRVSMSVMMLLYDVINSRARCNGNDHSRLTGGYLCVMDVHAGRYVRLPVGLPDIRRHHIHRQSSWRLAAELCRQLKTGILSSAELKDERLRRQASAIATGQHDGNHEHFIFSMAGLPEPIGIPFSLAMAMRLGRLKESRARQIVTTANTSYFEPLLARMKSGR